MSPLFLYIGFITPVAHSFGIWPLSNTTLKVCVNKCKLFSENALIISLSIQSSPHAFPFFKRFTALLMAPSCGGYLRHTYSFVPRGRCFHLIARKGDQWILWSVLFSRQAWFTGLDLFGCVLHTSDRDVSTTLPFHFTGVTFCNPSSLVWSWFPADLFFSMFAQPGWTRLAESDCVHAFGRGLHTSLHVWHDHGSAYGAVPGTRISRGLGLCMLVKTSTRFGRWRELSTLGYEFIVTVTDDWRFHKKTQCHSLSLAWVTVSE